MYLWLAGFVVLLLIALPIFLAVITRRRWGAPWSYFCAGLLTFVIAQVIHIPLNRLLQEMGLLPESLPQGTELVLTALILGLTAALSEELIRTAGYYLLKKARRFGDGILMGLGHGGMEAMIVAVLLAAGASSFWYYQNIDIIPEVLSGEQFSAIRLAAEAADDSPLLAIAPLVERVIGLGYQVVLSIVVLLAFKRRKWWFILIAIAYHTLIDFVAVMAAAQIDNVWLVELILFVMLIPGFVLFWQMRRTYSEDAQPFSQSLTSELPSLKYSFRKEWLYQRRTKRLIIVLAIFVLFGMVSPLIAKFTPELLSNIEGAEQFASLVPEPTVADAIAQYISNLTQFGFLLALLLGMGAVAGEKEKGTAAMVLSKPLPRWAFITSKFLGQALVYLLSFTLAGMAAYFYILYLFETLLLGTFIMANLILFIWLLVFAGVTLLGSTLGRTTGSAAGISAGIGALVLIAGTIPKYGALAPGGLLSWAGGLAAGADVAPNAGAAAMALVLISLCLIISAAALEKQDI